MQEILFGSILIIISILPLYAYIKARREKKELNVLHTRLLLSGLTCIVSGILMLLIFVFGE